MWLITTRSLDRNQPQQAFKLPNYKLLPGLRLETSTRVVNYAYGCSSGAAIAGNIIIIMQHMVSIQSSWCKCGKHASLKTTGDTDSTSVLEISLFDGLGSVVKTRKEETSDNSRSR